MMLDDEEANPFLSSSSAVPSPLIHDAPTQPLLTPVKDSHRTILAANQLNSQPAHRVISAPKPDPSSGIAFHHLAPLPARRFTPQPATLFFGPQSAQRPRTQTNSSVAAAQDLTSSSSIYSDNDMGLSQPAESSRDVS
ncbi:hypothetical protein P692DRAFT_20823561, partial [Suillus brevipes Sb2]